MTAVKQINDDDDKISSPALSSVSPERLDRWRKILEEKSLTQKTFYLVSDTETTGTQIYEEQSKEFNRVLEWGMVLCEATPDGLLKPMLDEDGSPIVINEPINFFIEPRKNKKQKSSVKHIDPKSTKVHGLTIEYLFAKPCEVNTLTADGGLAENEADIRPPLAQCAAYFEMVFFALQRLFNFSAYMQAEITVHVVFHNAPFDVGFLNHEMEMAEHPPLESFFIPLDTLKKAQRIIPSKELPSGYSLDSLFEFGKSRYPDHIKDLDRPYHGALIDSMILVEVWNTIQLYANEHSHHTALNDESDEPGADNENTTDEAFSLDS